MKFFAPLIALAVVAGSVATAGGAYAAPVTASGSAAAVAVVAPAASTPAGDPALTPDSAAAPTLAGAGAAGHPLVMPPVTPPASPEPSTQQVAPDTAPTGGIQGRVYSDYNDGKQTNGITVTAYTFDANWNVTSQVSTITHQILTSNSIGMFGFALAPGDYWLLFTDSTDPAHPTSQWYGSTFDNQGGAAITVADTTVDIVYNVVRTGNVTGTVTCEGCSAAPDPSTADVVLTTYDPSTNQGTYVDDRRPNADGSYGWTSLRPGLYMTFVDYSGTGPYSPTSNSQPYTIVVDQTQTANVIISHLIAPIPGFDDQYGKVGNSVVNALYWDYLGRLPSLGEASGWVQLLYYGTPPSAVSDGFVNSDEYRLDRIDAAYQTILGRAPDGPGRAGWLANMKAGRITTDDIETSLYASQEYFVNHGGTNKLLAKALYTDLLHRSGSDSDYTFWGNLAAQHGRDWVIKQFWDEPETIGARVTLMYEKYLGRTPDAGGLQGWVNVALAIGDSGLRSGLTSSEEYIVRSQFRYSES